MTDSPLVTIGLPVYDSERYLPQSLNSLLSQTYTNFVLIISDNASTDGTARICQEFAARDSRVKYFRNEHNIGNPRNFNRVFNLATTKYLKWSTSDDFVGPTFLERAVAVMERDESVVLCYPKTYTVDENGQNPAPYEDKLHLVQEDPVARFLALYSTIELAHQHLGLIRCDVLRRTHLLGAYVGSDVVLLAELTLYGKFSELPERLFYRRFHAKSGSWKRDDAKHQAERYLAARERKHVGLRTWHRLWGHFAAVNSSPLPLRSKLKIYRRLLSSVRGEQRHLLAEVLALVRPRSRGS